MSWLNTLSTVPKPIDSAMFFLAPETKTPKGFKAHKKNFSVHAYGLCASIFIRTGPKDQKEKKSFYVEVK